MTGQICKKIKSKIKNYIFIKRNFSEYDKFQWRSAEEIERIRTQKLKNIVKKAVDFVPFYKNLDLKINFENFTLDELKKFPIINKQMIRENFKDFCSVKFSGKASHTSGSTGAPFEFKVPYESDAIEKIVANRAWGMGKDYTYKSGDPIIVLRTYSPKAGEPLYKISGDYWYLSPFHINESNLALYLSVIEKSKAKIIRGYASSIYIFTLLLKQKNIKIPQIKEILEILDEDTFLNTDVSLLSQKKQVILKILEIKYASFLGYTIALKNTLPFIDDIQKNINEISKNNRLFLLDYKKISYTKEEILEAYYENNKLKRTSYLYEIFGYKKISTIINKIRKEKVCQYCNGKGKLREENLYENIDITETPCSFCNETGLSIEGLNTEIEGISIKEWYYGSIDRINKDLPDELKNLSLMSKICDLNKEQLIKLKEYLK
ncbi:hypothetical protein [uncultured Campylobacter sp.]|uniref:hypothetical protein n=1 Tax=uncultured Campylobacter sp. TaxID=218934 RepID=UPI0026122B3A|nr:hypothetical protein [uncultured Campylobacter sp.]